MAKRRRNSFFDRFRTQTHYHIERGTGRVAKARATGSYKGYRIYDTGDGWTVPELDKESVFESKREAKRFVDYQVKHMNKRNSKKRNPRHWFALSVVEPRGGRSYVKNVSTLAKAREEAKLLAAQEGADVIIERETARGIGGIVERVRKPIGNRKRNAGVGTMIPAMVKKAKDGALKVYVDAKHLVKLNPRQARTYAIYRKDTTKGYAWHRIQTGFPTKSAAQKVVRGLKRPSDRAWHVYWKVHEDIGQMFGD